MGFQKKYKTKVLSFFRRFCVINHLVEPSGIKNRISRAQVREIGNDNNNSGHVS